VQGTLEQLPNYPFSSDGPMARCFGAVGVRDFAGAARHVLQLPCGRIADRAKFWLVVSEGKGTCTTKHALLAELAHEQNIDVQLALGIFEMNERNTSGVGQVLTKRGLTYIPEAHCYLRYRGGYGSTSQGCSLELSLLSGSSTKSSSRSNTSAPTRSTSTSGSYGTGLLALRRSKGGASRRCGASVRTASQPWVQESMRSQTTEMRLMSALDARWRHYKEGTRNPRYGRDVYVSHVPHRPRWKR